MFSFIKWVFSPLFGGRKNRVEELPEALEDDYEDEEEYEEAAPRVTTPKIAVVIPKDYALPSAILNGVNNILLRDAMKIIDKLRSQGHHAIIHNAMRTKAQAAANAAKGVGIKNSRHVLGRAVDIIDKRYGWDNKYIKQIRVFRSALGKEVAKYPHLTWGGNWHNSYGELGDWAHVEMK